jgi:hypothetical protein
VVELYARTEHANGLYYLMFGLHGLTGLVPWFWSSLVLMVGAFVMFLMPSFRNDFGKLLPIPCAMAFAGIWIEKGMGLIVPGFIPTPIGEVTEYYPTFVEWLMVLGIWAFGFFILTILLKGAIGILLGEIKYGGPAAAPSEDAIMRKLASVSLILALCGGRSTAVSAGTKAQAAAQATKGSRRRKAPVECFESRKGASEVTQRDLKPGWPNVKCSPKTGAALWYGDPYDGTVPMGKMPGLDKIPKGMRWSSRAPGSWPDAAVRHGLPQRRRSQVQADPKDKKPVPIPTMEAWCPTPRICSTAAAASGAWTATTRPSATCWWTTSAIRSASTSRSCCAASATATSCATGVTASTASASANSPARARSAGSPAPNATTRTTCRTAPATRGSSSSQPEAPPQLPKGMKDAKHEKLHGIAALMSDSSEKQNPVRGDPTWVAPALTRDEKTRNVGKTPVFFGPPLAILTDGQKNTMEISGKLNRTAERYMEMMEHHGWNSPSPSACASPISAISASCRRWRSANCPLK